MKNLYKNLLLALAFAFALPSMAQPTVNEVNEILNKCFNKAEATDKTRSIAEFMKEKELVLYWNGTKWDTTAQNFYTYTSAALLEQVINQTYAAGTFTNDSKEFYVYDANGNTTLYSTYYWNDSTSTWTIVTKDTSAYDEQGSNTLNLSLQYNDTTGQWDTLYGSRMSYNYNANFLVTSEISESWDAATGVWNYDTKLSYTYNANNEYTDIDYQTWDGTTWTNMFKITNLTWHNFAEFEMLTATIQIWAGFAYLDYFRITNTYNADGNILSSTQQTYSTTTFSWENSGRTTYTYTGLMLTQEVNETWDAVTAAWVYDSRTSYQFDAQGNQTESYTEIFDGTQWVGDSGQRDIYTYDANNNISVDEIHYFEALGGTWEPSVMYIYDYTFITAVNNLAVNNFTIYPNPATEFVTVNLTAGTEKASVNIFDVTGKVVYSKEIAAGASQVKVELNALVKGAYFLQVNSKKGVSTSKIIKN